MYVAYRPYSAPTVGRGGGALNVELITWFCHMFTLISWLCNWSPGQFVDHASGSGNETGDHACSVHAISGMHRGLASLLSLCSLYLTAKQLSPLTFIDSVNVSATLHCHSEKVATLPQGGTPR